MAFGSLLILARSAQIWSTTALIEVRREVRRSPRPPTNLAGPCDFRGDGVCWRGIEAIGVCGIYRGILEVSVARVQGRPVPDAEGGGIDEGRVASLQSWPVPDAEEECVATSWTQARTRDSRAAAREVNSDDMLVLLQVLLVLGGAGRRVLIT